MQVAAFSNPGRPDWRWRIVNYAGDVIEESRETFTTIAAAVATGQRRMRELDTVDTSTPRHGRWTRRGSAK